MSDGQTATPESMRWPGLRHKLGAAGFLRWPAYFGFWVSFRNWYHGHWLMISFGWFGFTMGYGTYD